MKFILVVDLDGSDLGAIGPISNDQRGPGVTGWTNDSVESML